MTMNWLLFSQILNPVTSAVSKLLGNKIGYLCHQWLWTRQTLKWTSTQWLILFLLLNWVCLFYFLSQGKTPSFQLFNETHKNVHTISFPSSSLFLALPPSCLFSQFVIDFRIKSSLFCIAQKTSTIWPLTVLHSHSLLSMLFPPLHDY